MYIAYIVFLSNFPNTFTSTGYGCAHVGHHCFSSVIYFSGFDFGGSKRLQETVRSAAGTERYGRGSLELHFIALGSVGTATLLQCGAQSQFRRPGPNPKNGSPTEPKHSYPPGRAAWPTHNQPSYESVRVRAEATILK